MFVAKLIGNMVLLFRFFKSVYEFCKPGIDLLGLCLSEIGRILRQEWKVFTGLVAAIAIVLALFTYVINPIQHYFDVRKMEKNPITLVSGDEVFPTGMAVYRFEQLGVISIKDSSNGAVGITTRKFNEQPGKLSVCVASAVQNQCEYLVPNQSYMFTDYGGILGSVTFEKDGLVIRILREPVFLPINK